MKLRLDRKEKSELKSLLSVTRDKKEYRRALGVLMGGQKKRVTDEVEENTTNFLRQHRTNLTDLGTMPSSGHHVL